MDTVFGVPRVAMAVLGSAASCLLFFHVGVTSAAAEASPAFSPSGILSSSKNIYGDINGDGNMDAVSVASGATARYTIVHAHLNDGDNGFGARSYSYDVSAKGITTVTNMFFTPQLRRWWRHQSVTLDLYVVGTTASGKQVNLRFASKGDGTFAAPIVVKSSRLPFAWVRFAYYGRRPLPTNNDVDRDHKPDTIALIETDPLNRIFRMSVTLSSNGGKKLYEYELPAEFVLGLPVEVKSLSTIDYDGDGDVDIVAVLAHPDPFYGGVFSTIAVFRNDGTAHFPTVEAFYPLTPLRRIFGDTVALFPDLSLDPSVVPAFSDLDGDGHLELHYLYNHFGSNPGIDERYSFEGILEFR